LRHRLARESVLIGGARVAFAADDNDAPASQIGGLSGRGTPGHGGKIVAAGRDGESVACFSARA